MRAACLATLLCLCACADDEATRVCSGVALDRPLLVLEQALDLSASGLGRVDREGCLEEVADISLGTDPWLADAHGRPFVLNRQNGEIHEIDGQALRYQSTFTAMAPGQPSPNPWDVDIDADGVVWVARYELPSIGLVRADGTWVAEIDLGDQADADGNPEAAAVEVVGSEAFVFLERLAKTLEGYEVTQPGRVVAFDLAAPHDTVAAFDLLCRNPFSVTRAVGDDNLLVVSSPGDHFSVDAQDGVEIVDAQQRATRQVLSETTVGGSVIAAVIAAPNEGYAIVSGPSDENPTSVIAFDPERGELVATLATAPTFAHAGLTLVGNYLVVGDRTKSATQLLFFDRATHDLVGSLTPQLLPPLALMPL